MAFLQLPITNDLTSYSVTYSLDSTKYEFQFRYNRRNDTWYLTLVDTSGVVLVESIPCLTSNLGHTSYLNPDVFPIGEIVFFDLSPTAGRDCTLDNFGNSIQLFYKNARAEA